MAENRNTELNDEMVAKATGVPPGVKTSLLVTPRHTTDKYGQRHVDAKSCVF